MLPGFWAAAPAGKKIALRAFTGMNKNERFLAAERPRTYAIRCRL